MSEYTDNEFCENCNKFSYCNNNDLICISRYELLFSKLKEVKSLAEAIVLGKHFPKEGHTEIDVVKGLAEEIVEIIER